MNMIKAYWHKICEPLDGYLWRKGITHRAIRPLLRNQILASGMCLLFGGVCFLIWPNLFWTGMGLAIMAWSFWSWAHFFMKTSVRESRSAVLSAALLRFFGRLALIAFLLYVALAVCKASAGAIITGMACSVALALASCAYYLAAQKRHIL